MVRYKEKAKRKKVVEETRGASKNKKIEKTT